MIAYPAGGKNSKLEFGIPLLLNDEQPPVSRYPLEVMRASIRELAPGARNQILDRARNEHFARLRQGSDAGRDMYGGAADMVLNDLTLPSVQSSANLQPQRTSLLPRGA